MADANGANVAQTISDQVSGQWNSILAMMTAQGASRADLISLAAMTARSLLVMTANPLWPDGSLAETTPADERDIAVTVEDINRRLGALLHALGHEVG